MPFRVVACTFPNKLSRNSCICMSVKPIYTQSSVKLSFATIATRKDEQSIATVANKIKRPKDLVVIIILSLRSLNHLHRP